MLREEIKDILFKYDQSFVPAKEEVVDQLLQVITKRIKERVEEYKCDFNWDFEKNKERHKSYIALSDFIKILEEELGKEAGIELNNQ